MTQEELVSALDVNSATVFRSESCKQPPGYIALWQYSYALDISNPVLLDKGKVRIYDVLQCSYDMRYRKLNISTRFEHILSDLAGINLDIIVVIYKIVEALDGIDAVKRQIGAVIETVQETY